MGQPDAAKRAGALPRPGDVVDRYRVLDLIATGGMAAVFTAQRSSIGGFERLVALKVMLPHLAADRYFVDMFLDEARIVSRVHHANVVQVFDVVEHGGLPCIVMELLQGQSLAKLNAHNDPIDVGLRLLVLARAADGLHAAHTTLGGDGDPLGIIHRDVSPDNVHVGYDGHVKVVDFGIAAARGRLGTTRTGEVKGKLAYLSPEQLTSAPEVSQKVDVWGLAVMAWETLARQRLFVGDGDGATMWNVVHRPVPDLGALCPDVDADVVAAVMKGLARPTTDRIEMGALAKALAVGAERCGASGAALSEAVGRNFADAAERDREHVERTLSGALALTTPNLLTPGGSPVPSAESARSGAREIAATADGADPVVPKGGVRVPAQTRIRRSSWVAIVAALVVGGGTVAAASALLRSPEPEQQTQSPPVPPSVVMSPATDHEKAVPEAKQTAAGVRGAHAADAAADATTGVARPDAAQPERAAATAIGAAGQVTEAGPRPAPGASRPRRSPGKRRGAAGKDRKAKRKANAASAGNSGRPALLDSPY